MAQRLKSVEVVRVVVSIAVMNVGCDPAAPFAERALEEDAATGEVHFESCKSTCARSGGGGCVRVRGCGSGGRSSPPRCILLPSRASALVPRDGDRFARLRGRLGSRWFAGRERLAQCLVIGAGNVEVPLSHRRAPCRLQVTRERPANLGGDGAIPRLGASAKLGRRRESGTQAATVTPFFGLDCCHQGSLLEALFPGLPGGRRD